MHICCAGEVMVEMAAASAPGLYRRGIAGDTYNTAVYLARAGLHVSYLTRLGDDSFSDEMLAQMQRENIDTRWVQRASGRRPGLYVIDNDSDGERHFHYWRDSSAARGTFAEALELAGIDAFYFTGITLAITRHTLEHLLTTLRQLRQRGCRIIFDPNYRPRLWQDVNEARDCCRAVLGLCDSVLPTLDDDRALWGVDDAAASTQLYREFGVNEIVIKGDALTTHASTGESALTLAAQPVNAVDTTGAGDSFNAGYLAARLQGMDLASAIGRAQQLAADVVQHRGAIMPRG